jgi:outer membrane protein OmpA-like peptidoglycan-associated protein
MRFSSLLTLVFLSVATHASAQVTIDLHALQALPGRTGTSAPPRVALPAPLRPGAGRTQVVLPPTEPSVSAKATPSAPVVTPPALPQELPQTASITPIAPSPPAVESASPPPPVSDKAATSAAPTNAGLRVSFAPGQSELSPASVESIKQLAAATPMGDTTSFNVLAYAPGAADDPSTARRVSLSRAMAVRSALVADGVSSARIYVRAMGAQFGDGPPDRVDVNVLGANAPGDTAAQATPK